MIFPRSMYCNLCTWPHQMCWLTHCYTMLHVLAYTHLHTVVNTNHLLRHSSAIWSTHRHDHRRSGFHRHTPISCCASYSSAQFHNHFHIKLANTRCSPMQDRKIAPPRRPVISNHSIGRALCTHHAPGWLHYTSIAPKLVVLRTMVQ